jgi:hypothetical protein
VTLVSLNVEYNQMYVFRIAYAISMCINRFDYVFWHSRSLEPLQTCRMLESLNVRCNRLDVVFSAASGKSTLSALSELPNLWELKLEGNVPLCSEDKAWLGHAFQALNAGQHQSELRSQGRELVIDDIPRSVVFVEEDYDDVSSAVLDLQSDGQLDGQSDDNDFNYSTTDSFDDQSEGVESNNEDAARESYAAELEEALAEKTEQAVRWRRRAIRNAKLRDCFELNLQKEMHAHNEFLGCYRLQTASHEEHLLALQTAVDVKNEEISQLQSTMSSMVTNICGQLKLTQSSKCLLFEVERGRLVTVIDRMSQRLAAAETRVGVASVLLSERLVSSCSNCSVVRCVLLLNVYSMRCEMNLHCSKLGVDSSRYNKNSGFATIQMPYPLLLLDPTQV